MASLNTLRTKFGIVLSIVIGGALLAFILSLKTEMGFSGNDPEVGEINGESISYSEYMAAYNNVKAQMGDNAYTEEQAAQLIAAAWQQILADHVLNPGLEELGIAVSDAERTGMLAGDYNSAVYNSVFGEGYTAASVAEFLAQVQANPQLAQLWDLINRQAVLDRSMTKYLTLVGAGANVNSLEVERSAAAENKTYAGRYAVCRYNSVPDSLVSVSNSEIKAYYKQHKNLYKQLPYRSLSYVAFEVEPTDEDRAAVEADAKAAAEAFGAAADIRAYVRENRHASIARNFVTAANLSEEEAKALSAGKMYGPELANDEWKASRVVEVRNVPETYTLRHIVLSYTDEKLADSLMSVVNAKNFAELAGKYSLAETAENGGEIGEVPYSELAMEFADVLKGAKKGETVKLVVGNSIQLINVTATGKNAKHMQIANLTYPIEASQATRRTAHNAASTFAVGAKGDVESFNKTASEQSLSTRTAKVSQGERLVRGLEDSGEIVRWAEDAKVGKISEIFNTGDSYVVAIVTEINDDEYQSVGEVANQIRTTLLRDKKYDILAAKLQGATIEEAAAAADVKVNTFEDAKLGSYYIQGIGVEPRVLGSIAAAEAGALSKAIKGNSGAYIYVVDTVTEAEEPQTVENERVKLQSQAEALAGRRASMAIQDAAQIKDNTVKYF